MVGQLFHTGSGAIPVTSAIPAVRLSCTTQSLLCPAGEITVLRVAGEVDLGTLPILQAALDYALGARPTHLVVDLAAMTFCSVRGLALLTTAGRTAAEKTIGYAVSAMRPHPDLVWTLCWDGDLPTRHPSTTAALTAIQAAG